MAEFNVDDLGYVHRPYPKNKPYLVSGEAKLYLALSAYQRQREFNSYERKDKAPSNVHFAVVDPGMMRSPSLKRFFSLGGRLWTILVYLILWPIWWLFFKSSVDGAQTMLFACLAPDVINTHEVSYISQCKVRDVPPRSEFKDEEKQKLLVERTRTMLEQVEKHAASERNKKEKAEQKQSQKTKKNKPQDKK
ncbi:hypothetical protein FF38_13681 [Lucilia cuprina]|uniref:Uncharacterized protein n=1 Tax=Lucilia cuprina TaxID=7375 RepID=A0A0L0CR99_LUCCU|nr:hypothetical protein FF38_13681 [Lucilia cuprina]